MQVLPPELPQLKAREHSPSAARRAVTVWDLPLRLFHWALLLLFVIAYETGSRPQDYSVHEAAGLALFGLLIFRLIWGFIGNRAARFSGFLNGPRAVAAHIQELRQGHAAPAAGHNPLGGWAVMVMLVLLLVESVSGLFSSTFDYSGPLAPLVSDDWADRMATIHALNLDLLLAMIGLHLIGIAVTSIMERTNLVASMIHGRKLLALAPGSERAPGNPWLRATIAVLAAAALTGGVLLLGHLIGGAGGV
jgi:cytochrome b